MAGRLSLLPDQWEMVKQAAIAGTPFSDIQAQFPSLTYDAFRKASQRGDWPLPGRLLHKAAKATKQAANAMNAQRGIVPLSTLSQNGSATASDIALQSLQQGKDDVITKSLSFVRRAGPVFERWTPNVPETTKEASILLAMLHRAVGLDRGDSGLNQFNIQLTLGSETVGPWSRRQDDTQFIDVESEQAEE